VPPGAFGEPKIVSEARQALGIYGIPVCDVAISQRAALGHALIDGRAVCEFDQEASMGSDSIDRGSIESDPIDTIDRKETCPAVLRISSCGGH
jgi:hypothetical protein